MANLNRPVVVETGLLSDDEYAAIADADVQRSVEQETVRLMRQYGLSWLRLHRGRLRDELMFFHGF